MCYEWLYWKSKTEKAEKQEQPETVTERTPPATQPAPAAKKPEKVEAELETV